MPSPWGSGLPPWGQPPPSRTFSIVLFPLRASESPVTALRPLRRAGACTATSTGGRAHLPTITIVGQIPHRSVAPPAPNTSAMHCGEWRGLDMGRGQVQVCEWGLLGGSRFERGPTHPAPGARLLRGPGRRRLGMNGKRRSAGEALRVDKNYMPFDQNCVEPRRNVIPSRRPVKWLDPSCLSIREDLTWRDRNVISMRKCKVAGGEARRRFWQHRSVDFLPEDTVHVFARQVRDVFTVRRHRNFFSTTRDSLATTRKFSEPKRNVFAMTREFLLVTTYEAVEKERRSSLEQRVISARRHDGAPPIWRAIAFKPARSKAKMAVAGHEPVSPPGRRQGR